MRRSHTVLHPTPYTSAPRMRVTLISSITFSSDSIHAVNSEVDEPGEPATSSENDIYANPPDIAAELSPDIQAR